MELLLVQRDRPEATAGRVPDRDGDDLVVRLAAAVAGLLLGVVAGDDRGDLDAAARTLIGELADLLGEVSGLPPSSPEPAWPVEPLTQGETRVLPFLVTHLSAREIAAELCVSANTVKTHLRHLYQKLGAHSRREAVHRARAIGLLPASSRRLLIER